MKISLIIPTIGRKELGRLLESLSKQTIQDFELIVVDQSYTTLTKEILENYNDTLNVKLISSDLQGASRARNLGLNYASGDIIGWPDDDCFYAPDVLEVVNKEISICPDGTGFVGNLYDLSGKPFPRRELKKFSPISLLGAFLYANETAIFVRKEALVALGGFDEDIGTGAGTLWGAGEATDLLVRYIKQGCCFYSAPQIKIFHPLEEIRKNEKIILKKAYSYSLGMGAVLRKSRLKTWMKLVYFGYYLRSVFWSAVRLKFHGVHYHSTRLMGLINGYLLWRD